MALRPYLSIGLPFTGPQCTCINHITALGVCQGVTLPRWKSCYRTGYRCNRANVMPIFYLPMIDSVSLKRILASTRDAVAFGPLENIFWARGTSAASSSHVSMPNGTNNFLRSLRRVPWGEATLICSKRLLIATLSSGCKGMPHQSVK